MLTAIRSMRRVTIVTGASSGIGAATARVLAAPEECLVLHARGGVAGSKITLLERVADDVMQAGSKASHITGQTLRVDG